MALLDATVIVEPDELDRPQVWQAKAPFRGMSLRTAVLALDMSDPLELNVQHLSLLFKLHLTFGNRMMSFTDLVTQHHIFYFRIGRL